MHDFRPVGVIRHLNGDRLVLFESQQGTGDLPVVGGGPQSMARREIERDRRNIDLVDRRGQIARQRGERGSQAEESGELEKVAPRNHSLQRLFASARILASSRVETSLPLATVTTRSSGFFGGRGKLISVGAF
jgi:hypothetical protein